ncbi:helix-turn-helix domain-containing protein [Rhodococcus pyridinivorans]|uniref:helix-turn-helix domain-containing protein n=1 Tax=Rhodococcus pyridinivorans TaxID=103816 RepID=UPI000BA28B26
MTQASTVAGADGGVRSVARAFDLLNAFDAEHPIRTLRELVGITGLPKSTVVDWPLPDRHSPRVGMAARRGSVRPPAHRADGAAARYAPRSGGRAPVDEWIDGAVLRGGRPRRHVRSAGATRATVRARTIR